MLQITERRITEFCRLLLEQGGDVRNIGFVDVGSGGDLKEPWALLPVERLTTFDFEPTRQENGQVPLCVSDKNGRADFFVAYDERASSFHKPLEDFVDRYAFDGMLTKKAITVDCVSLDSHFSGRYEMIDAIDINVEGHDFQVLQGATQLLTVGMVKLLKVEFELIPAYEGQGYFSDIDALLRAKGFRLAGIQIDYVRPIAVRSIFFPGEPLWGKALYVPEFSNSLIRMQHLHDSGDLGGARREMATSIALYASAKMPGFAFDAIAIAEEVGLIASSEGDQLRSRLVNVFRWAKAEEGLRRLERLRHSFTAILK